MQPYSNGCQSFQNFYRYPPPPPPFFNEHRMCDPRGLGTPVNFPAAERPPPQPVRPCPPMQPFPVGPAPGCPPSLRPFHPHILQPSYQQPPNRSCGPIMTPPFSALSGPFNRPPTQNGHTQGFVPHCPPPNCSTVSLPCTNIPPPNYPLPPFPVRNCPAPAFNIFDQRVMAQRPVNTSWQRLPGSRPFSDQNRGFPMKRQLNSEHNKGKVHALLTLLLHVQ